MDYAHISFQIGKVAEERARVVTHFKTAHTHRKTEIPREHATPLLYGDNSQPPRGTKSTTTAATKSRYGRPGGPLLFYSEH